MKTVNVKDCSTSFGQFVREGRLKKQMLQTELAEMSGVTQAYISQIESGRRNAELGLALIMCGVLDLDIRVFISELCGLE